MRVLLQIHRYLGILGGALMLLWCASGFVMMYVAYPKLSEARRLAGLDPIDWAAFREQGPRLPAGANAPLRIEMLAGRPVLSHYSLHGPELSDLEKGAPLGRVPADQAARVAGQYSRGAAQRAPQLLGLIRDDQWTVSGRFAADRPLYRFALGDDERTEVYVSSVTGQLVQATTSSQRFWNWLGPIPHWLYFFELRRSPRAWQNVVIASCLVGCFLTFTGLFLGFRHLPRRFTPGEPWLQMVRNWHHMAGLLFGIFALTWVWSGLMSVEPWGLLAGHALAPERVRGPAPSARQVESAIAALSVALAGTSFVSVQLSPLDSRPFFIARSADGATRRFDATGHASPLTERDFSAMARRLGSPAPTLVTREDAYLFSHHDEGVELPAYRLTSGDPDPTYLYLNATTGVIEAQLDGNARASRWVEGLHRMDVLPALRARPAWDVLVLLLLSGVSAVCATGAWLGYARLFVRKR
jgi:uncharacterized iron-regulated membrane protein